MSLARSRDQHVPAAQAIPDFLEFETAFSIDTRAPQTTIASGPVPTATGGTRTVKVEFGADEAASFRCTLDGAVVARCAPPQLVLRDLAKGRHRLTIAATDAAGNAEATPATRTFSIDSPPDIPLDRTVRATKGGALRLTLRCPATQATGPCAGTLTASRDGRPALAKAVGFEIAPGARAVVRATLKPADRRVLRRNGRLRVRVTLVAADGRGNVGRASARRTLTLQSALVGGSEPGPRQALRDETAVGCWGTQRAADHRTPRVDRSCLLPYLHCERCGLQIRAQTPFMRVDNCPRCLARTATVSAMIPTRTRVVPAGGWGSGERDAAARALAPES